MKFWPLIRSALLRRPVEAALIFSAVTVGFALFGWLLFNEAQIINGRTIFRLHISGPMVVSALMGAGLLAIIGGLLPAIRAARLPVADALRAT